MEIFDACDEIGLDPVELGESTVSQNLANRGSTIIGIVNIVGIGPTLKGVQRINSQYNRSKIVKTSGIDATGGIVEMFYVDKLPHSTFLTMQNIGCYIAVLKYLGYEDINYTLEADDIYPHARRGYTRVRFHWKKKSFLNRLYEFFVGVLAERVFSRYLASNRYLHSHHSLLLQNYEYQINEKESAFKRIEAEYAEQMRLKDAELKNAQEQLSVAQTHLIEQTELLKDQISNWIDKNLHDSDLKAKDLAIYFNMSEPKSNRKLRDYFGMTFKQLLTQRRMDKAKSLLQSESSTSVAYTVGYKSPSHFSQNFKTYTGQTPSEWKLSLTKESNTLDTIETNKNSTS